MDKPISDIHHRIRQALEIRDMKQAELSRRTGIPKSPMSQYISGNYKPKQDRIYLMAKALDVSEVWLMGYDVPMERHSEKDMSKSAKLSAYMYEHPMSAEIFGKYIELNDDAKNTVNDMVNFLHQKQFG